VETTACSDTMEAFITGMYQTPTGPGISAVYGKNAEGKEFTSGNEEHYLREVAALRVHMGKGSGSCNNITDLEVRPQSKTGFA